MSDIEFNSALDGAIGELKRYFEAPVNEADKGKKVDRALILLGRKNGMDSTRLKALALHFQIARAIGVKGDELRPLLDVLGVASGEMLARAQPALGPAAGEDSKDDVPAVFPGEELKEGHRRRGAKN